MLSYKIKSEFKKSCLQDVSKEIYDIHQKTCKVIFMASLSKCLSGVKGINCDVFTKRNIIKQWEWIKKDNPCKNVDSFTHNIEKILDTESAFIYIKFKFRQNSSMLLKIRSADILGGETSEVLVMLTLWKFIYFVWICVYVFVREREKKLV